jgi:hypothetical protein
MTLENLLGNRWSRLAGWALACKTLRHDQQRLLKEGVQP